MKPLSTDLICLTTHISLPETALQAIGTKAKELINLDGAISPAPGQNPDARMVLSRRGKRPHLVTPKRSGGYACDDDCPQYRSSRLCSHVVAAAEDAGKLPNLVASFGKVKRVPDITKLATTSMPRGRGRKGSRAPSKRTPSTDIEQRAELNPSQSSSPVISVSTLSNPCHCHPLSISLGLGEVDQFFQLQTLFLPCFQHTPLQVYLHFVLLYLFMVTMVIMPEISIIHFKFALYLGISLFAMHGC